MEPVPNLKCACGNCGHVIEYARAAVGETVECPNCKEKSRLPEPPLFQPNAAEPTPAEQAAVKPVRPCPACGSPMEAYGNTCPACAARRRRNIGLVIGLLSAVIVLGIGWLFLRKYFNPPSSARPVFPAHMILQQPQVKTPKTKNDLRIGAFSLQNKRGSDVLLAVGDIQNVSGNSYLRLSVTLDLLDTHGAKIGTATDLVTELPPNSTWHFIATVTDHRAKSIRFVDYKELP